MNENNMDDLNKKLIYLSKRCDSLEDLNKEYMKSIQLNQDNIHNLLMQIKLLRKEYKKEINSLKIYFDNKFQYISQIIFKNKEIPKEIKDDNMINNDLFDISNIFKEINKIIEKKLEKFKYDIFAYVGDKSSNESKVLIDDKRGNILDKFENKILNIFYDKNQKIPDKDIKDLKKLGATLLIKHKIHPENVSKTFIDKNLKFKEKEMNQFDEINFRMKKGTILSEMSDVSMRKISTSDEDEFIEEFKEKYGILDEEISNEELKKEMIKNNYEEEKVIEVILKKLQYLK